MHRREYLKGTAGVTGASLLAGCESLPFIGDGGDGSGTGNEGPQLTTGLLVPTVALETTVDGEQTWVPREVRTGRGGDRSGWQVPLMGEKWSPSGDRGDFEFDLNPFEDKQDVSPPDWFPEDTDYNLQNDYYRVPCQYFTSAGGEEDTGNGPAEISAAMLGSSTLGDGFPTDSVDSGEEVPMMLEMSESVAGFNARHIGRAQFGTTLRADNPFFDAAQAAPSWEGSGDSGTLTATSNSAYGAIITYRDTLQDALKRGYEQLSDLQTFASVVFTAGVNTVGSSGSPLVRFAMEGAEAYLNEEGDPTGKSEGVPTSKKGVLLESLNRVKLWTTGYVSDGKTVQLSAGDPAPDPDTLNGADAVTGTAFFPPVNESMANADWELEDSAGVTGVDYARAGIGLSGPVSRSNAPAEFIEVSLTAPEGIVFGSEATLTVSVRNVGQTGGTYTDTLSLVEGAGEFSRDVSVDVPRGQTAATDVQFRPAVADTYTVELEEAGESATIETAANFGSVGSSLQIDDFPVPEDAVGFLSDDDGLRATLTDVSFQQSVFLDRSAYNDPGLASLNDRDRLFVAFLFEFENTGSDGFEVPERMFELGENARLLDSSDNLGTSVRYRPSDVLLPYGRVEEPARPATELELAPGQRREGFLLGVIGAEAARGLVELEVQNDAPDTPPEWEWVDGSDLDNRPLPQYELVSLDAPDSYADGETFEVTARVRNTGDGDGMFRGELQSRPTYNNDWDRVIPASPERVFREIGAGGTTEVTVEVNTNDISFAEQDVYRFAPFRNRTWTITRE